MTSDAARLSPTPPSSAPPSRSPRALARAASRWTPRRILLLVICGIVAALLFASTWARFTFPSDLTPEGAYVRVVIAVNRGRAQDFFAYTETRAQHACYTIRDYRKKTRDRVLASFPEPERSKRVAEYAEEAAAPDGADIFAIYARRNGWMNRLRRDMSGIAKIEIQGERATVETARGTRYPFRRRENGIWGLTLFTAKLEADAEKAARDLDLIEKSAADYDRAAKAESK
ncbi:MAG TPA: hypothetical protein VHV51_04020 [Polyangiaceae bacterium]|jgi:hypothetical protein|nr:hypothetical protein [Polyangiaceae bacterium]